MATTTQRGPRNGVPADSPGPSFPEQGRGSVATFGARLLAFILDGIIADLISILVLGGYSAGTKQNVVVWTAFLLLELFFVWLAGQTPGMRVAGLIVVRFGDGQRQQLRWILIRTVLIATIAPALITDEHHRAMHDRAAGTVMLRARD